MCCVHHCRPPSVPTRSTSIPAATRRSSCPPGPLILRRPLPLPLPLGGQALFRLYRCLPAGAARALVFRCLLPLLFGTQALLPGATATIPPSASLMRAPPVVPPRRAGPPPTVATAPPPPPAAPRPMWPPPPIQWPPWRARRGGASCVARTCISFVSAP